MSYILSIDQGTTGSTAMITTSNTLEVIDSVNKEFPQHYPYPGWVEHDLNEIWETIKSTIYEIIKKNKIDKKKIKCIGITNQRETICPFDNKGTPITKAIVWQDRRTSDLCNILKNKYDENNIRKKTGLPIDPYFSGSKINWLLNNSDTIKTHNKNKNLLWGTVDTYILFKLTNGSSFFTEPSNASRTLLMDVKNCNWDNKLLEIFQCNIESLPKIKNSFDFFGETSNLDFLPDGIPITGILGDQQSALLGQTCFNKGDIKCTYGTGAFALLNTGSNIYLSKSGLLTTVAYKSDETCYALEGSSYIAGAAVQWLRDNLEIIKNSSDIERLAKEIKELNELKHLLFIPFFSGAGTPYWKPSAKGTITGITRDTNKYHIARACLEGIALSIEDLITSIKSDSNINLKTLSVDGGAVTNDLLMQIQSNFSNLKIIRPKTIETTAYGACIAAAIGSKLTTFKKIKTLWKEDRVFAPENKNNLYYENKKNLWIDTITSFYL